MLKRSSLNSFDLNLLGNFFAFPEFAKRYGTYVNAEAGYQLSAPYQVGLSMSSQAGGFLGTILNGYLSSRYGHIRVLIGALLWLSAFLFITFFATSVNMLLVGQILCGITWGVFATTAPAYASEVVPLSIRVYLTSWTNMCFIIGQLIANGVLAGLVNLESQWAYRIPFALQWVWPAFLVPLLFFAPDTPWHLVRHGRMEDAEKSLRRLHTSATDEEIKDTLATIVHTNKLEQEMDIGTSYMDCFRGVERRRTEIACVVFAGQVLSGSSFAYNSSYFFQQVGLGSNTTYNLNVGGTGMALFGTLLSWFLIMPYFGRRKIYLTGMAGMCATLYTIGILNAAAGGNKNVGMAQAVLTLVWTFMFQLSVGQLGWAIPAEVGSTRLRQKTVCVARNAYYIVSIISQVLQPYFMNPTEWNVKGYVGFFWGSTALCTLVWAFFRLPETKGRTFEDIDVLFAKRVKAREFASYKIDASEMNEVVEAHQTNNLASLPK